MLSKSCKTVSEFEVSYILMGSFTQNTEHRNKINKSPTTQPNAIPVALFSFFLYCIFYGSEVITAGSPETDLRLSDRELTATCSSQLMEGLKARFPLDLNKLTCRVQKSYWPPWFTTFWIFIPHALNIADYKTVLASFLSIFHPCSN